MLRRAGLLLLLGTAAWSQPVYRVGIHLEFEGRPPGPELFQALQMGTADLLAPSGIAPEWRMLSDAPGNEVFTKVFKVIFKGTCSGYLPLSGEQIPDDPFERPMRLAATRVRDGEVLPEAEVECDHVRQGLARVPGQRQDAVIGVALAKVLVHELYHYLSNSAGHSDKGLAKAVLSWDELRQPVLQLDDDDLRSLRKSVSSRALPVLKDQAGR